MLCVKGFRENSGVSISAPESTPPLGFLSVRMLRSDWPAGALFVCVCVRTPMADVCGGEGRGSGGRGFSLSLSLSAMLMTRWVGEGSRRGREREGEMRAIHINI